MGMKVLGFSTIHYGKEYLKESLLSVVNHVDKMVISYAKAPSHGFRIYEECPDKEEEIFAICQEVLGDKLVWDSSSNYSMEAHHRNVRYRYCKGYDLILTVDADEVLKEDEIQGALSYAFNNKERYYGIDGYVNLWRSFNYACYDGFRPIRIENLNNNNELQNINCKLTIYHFSTCQSEAIMRYKFKIFGHANEIRPNWLDSIYYGWTPDNQIQNLHCVALGLWNAVPFDKNVFPEYLQEHVNFNKNLI